MAQHQGQYGATPQATDKYGNPISETRTDQYGNPVHHGMTGDTTGHGTNTTGEHRKEGVMDKIKAKIPGSGGGHVSETRTDQYGNPVHHGMTGDTTGPGTNTTGEHRKEGVMDKIKEKIPGSGGGHVYETRTDQHGNPVHHGTTGVTTGYGTATTGEHRKEGVMDKIPGSGGGHHRDADPYYPSQTTAAHGGTGYTGSEHHGEKGVTGKIKEKLPGTGGGHHTDEDPYSAHSHASSKTTTTAPYAGTTYTGDQHHEKKGMMEKIKEKLPGGNH